MARKLLNILLRDALYTIYLEQKYRLSRAEAFFETPMDSIAAAELKSQDPDGTLPRWLGVKHLTPEANAAYQKLAATIAEKQKLAVVHLDTYWWGVRSEDNE